MVKKQLLSISLIFSFLSLIWCIPGVSASTSAVQEIDTVTPTPVEETGLAQLSTFDSPEIGQIFSSGDQNKLFFTFDNYLDKFDISSYEFYDRFELSEELDNTILGVNENGELVALSADTGFYILNTLTKLKSPIYGNSSIEGYSFYSFLPPGKAFLYGVHHPTSAGDYTDLHVRGTDENNNVIGLDLKSPSDAPQYYGYRSPIPSPDGIYIAAGYSDFNGNRILIWKTSANDIYYEINDLPAEITTLDISPDSETLAAAGKDGIIRLWNMETAEFIETITGFNASITSIHYSEDGKELSISTEDRKRYTYNFVSKKVKQIYESEEMNHSLLIQKIDEGYLLESDEKRNFVPSPASLIFSPDDSKIALIQGTVRVWYAGNPEFLASFVPENRFRFSNATFDAASERLAILSDQGEVYVWNIDTGKTELHIPYDKMLDKQAPFSADNVSHAADNDLSDFSNQNIVFSPDGQQIAFANGMNIEIWNIVLAAKNKTLSTDGLSGRPEKLVFSEDGETITAVINTDQYLVTWNIRTGEIIDQFELTYSARIHGETTNICNSHFASLNQNESDSWIDLWNLQTHESVKLELANNTLFSSAFNTACTLFTTIDNANNLYIWRTDTGQLLYYENGFSINSTLAINPSGTMLAASEDEQITFWDLAPITEKGFQDGFVSPTLIPEQNGGFTFVTQPSATPTMAAATATQQQTQTEQEPTAAETNSTQQAVENPNNESPLLKVQQNQGIVTSIQWQNDKVLFSSTTGLYAYNLAKENLSLVFFIEEMDISSIEGLANANYLAAGMVNKNQIQLWNPTKPELLLSATGAAAPVISPNKKLMAYYLGNSRYMLWNISEKKSQFILTGYGPPASLAFSPDSKYIAVAQRTGLVQVWDTTKGTIEYAFNGDNTACSNIHFSSDGKSLIGITPGSVWIWPLTDDEQPVKIEVYATQSSDNDTYSNHYITAADINYSNEIIAIADDTGTIRFYTLEDRNLYRNMSQPEFEITRLAFAPEDNRLATVDVNGNLAIWDADSSEMVSELKFFNGTIYGMRTIDDGDIAAWTKTQVSIFDPETLEIRNETRMTTAEILDVSPNGKWAAAYTSNAIQLFDLNSADLLTTYTPEIDETNAQVIYGAAFSANNETLISFGTGGAWIYKLNQNNLSNTNLLGNIEASRVNLAALNDDGSRIILSPGEGYHRPKVYETTKQSGLVDIALAEYQTNLIAGQEYTAYAFHPDNERIVLLRSGLYDDARLEIASLATGNNLNYISFENTSADALALNQEGSRIAVGFDTGQIRIYDANKLSLLDDFYAHPASVSHLAFSRDGAYLFSAGDEGSIKSWIIE